LEKKSQGDPARTRSFKERLVNQFFYDTNDKKLNNAEGNLALSVVERKGEETASIRATSRVLDIK